MRLGGLEACAEDGRFKQIPELFGVSSMVNMPVNIMVNMPVNMPVNIMIKKACIRAGSRYGCSYCKCKHGQC